MPLLRVSTGLAQLGQLLLGGDERSAELYEIIGDVVGHAADRRPRPCSSTERGSATTASPRQPSNRAAPTAHDQAGTLHVAPVRPSPARSEERRVGKE